MTQHKHKRDKYTRKVHYRIAVCAVVAVIAGVTITLTENHIWHVIGEFFIIVPIDKLLDYLIFSD